MSLFIACLLIYHFDLSGFLYPLAFVIWWVHLMFHTTDAAHRSMPWRNIFPLGQ